MLDELEVAEVGDVRRTCASCFEAARKAIGCDTRTLTLAGVGADLAGICGLEVADFRFARI